MRPREGLSIESGAQEELKQVTTRHDIRPAHIDRSLDSSSTVSELIKSLTGALTDLKRTPVYLQITAGSRGRLEIRQIEFLGVEDLARLVKVEARTVQGWVQRGISPTPYRPPGSRCILFEMNEALAWIKQTAMTIARHG